MVPVVELRGAVPIGVGMGLPLVSTYIVAVLGNMLPVPIILLLAKPILIWCTKLPAALGRFFSKIYDKGVGAGEKLQAKAGRGIYWALFLFVLCSYPRAGHRRVDGVPGLDAPGPEILAERAGRAVRRHDGGTDYGCGLGGAVRRAGDAVRRRVIFRARCRPGFQLIFIGKYRSLQSHSMRQGAVGAGLAPPGNGFSSLAGRARASPTKPGGDHIRGRTIILS